MDRFDMLVKLYDLPQFCTENPRLASEGIVIRRPMAADKDKVLDFVKSNFQQVWVNECETAFYNSPFSCLIAVRNNDEIVGFSCYDASYRNFFGPIGVKEEYRGKGVGKELLLRSLYAMRDNGYAYCIIGMVEEKNFAFYNKVCGAIRIPDSYPGIYKNIIGIENW